MKRRARGASDAVTQWSLVASLAPAVVEHETAERGRRPVFVEHVSSQGCDYSVGVTDANKCRPLLDVVEDLPAHGWTDIGMGEVGDVGALPSGEVEGRAEPCGGARHGGAPGRTGPPVRDDPGQPGRPAAGGGRAPAPQQAGARPDGQVRERLRGPAGRHGPAPSAVPRHRGVSESTQRSAAGESRCGRSASTANGRAGRIAGERWPCTAQRPECSGGSRMGLPAKHGRYAGRPSGREGRQRDWAGTGVDFGVGAPEFGHLSVPRREYAMHRTAARRRAMTTRAATVPPWPGRLLE